MLSEVETAFKTLPASVPEFDHYPRRRTWSNTARHCATSCAELDDALDRFEGLYKQLNVLL